MSNVYEKLQQARVALQEKNLKKSGKNNYSGFTYYELADFIPTVNIIFKNLQLCSNFSIKDNEAQLIIINAEKPDEQILFTMPTATLELKGCTAIQALGGVNTYCRRYLYLNALEIVESDMLDGEAGNIEEKPKVKKEPTSKPEKVISLPTGIITPEDEEKLKKIKGTAVWAKLKTECKGHITYEKYNEVMEGEN
jgi:hypothetical protein